jgi:hypothetical protein
VQRQCRRGSGRSSADDDEGAVFHGVS